ncbi:MAG: hypothetical protein EZS28_010186 [Streblomastix strix]|uniref:Uncharacterized protein n=1 Tax=Streblomastix strix TaxID=222440 RepID=A0A5J4WGZ0_9EUKA|nr:MAG: hypothetical protein EZS28_010186 [Streblomastix strix]
MPDMNIQQLMIKKLIGKEVLHVNLDGNDTFIDASPTAEQVIQIWADENEQISRNPYARWQYANSGSFYYRDAWFYLLPESNTIQIKYKTDSGSSVAEIPFLVHSSSALTDFAEQCTVNTTYGSKSEMHYNSKSNTSKTSRSIAPKNITSPVNKKELAKKLKDLMKKNEKETLIKKRDKIDPLW